MKMILFLTFFVWLSSVKYSIVVNTNQKNLFLKTVNHCRDGIRTCFKPYSQALAGVVQWVKPVFFLSFPRPKTQTNFVLIR